MTDNNVITYYKSSLSHFSAAVGGVDAYVSDDLAAPISTMYPVSAATANTDIVFFDGKYTSYCNREWWGAGGSVIGHAKCFSTSSNGRCNKHQVRLHTGWADSRSYARRKSLTLHETGHTFGLSHRTERDDGAMEPSPTATWFNTHDISHLYAL